MTPRFKIYMGEEIRVITLDEIAYFFIWKHSVYAMTFNSIKYLMDLKLEKIMEVIRLYGRDNDFFRINRQMVINIKSIVKMVRHRMTKGGKPSAHQAVRLNLIPVPDFTVMTTKGSHTNEFMDWLGH